VPNSFSRFLNDDELARVRELYLASLEDKSLEEVPDGSQDRTLLPDPGGEKA
jgi:hypothetical protein